MVNKKNIIILIILGIIILIISSFIYNFISKKETSFYVKNVLIKINIPLGKELISKIKISNTLDKEQKFDLSLNNLENLAYLESSNILIEPYESKEINLHLKDNKKEVGVYTGKLNILGEYGKKYSIPIILGIDNPNSFLLILQKKMPNYDLIYPGGELGIEIKIFNLDKNSSNDIKVSYSIKNLDNEIIWSDEGDLAIINSEVSKIISIPKEWEYGEYVFITTTNYRDVKSTSGYLFEISENEKSYSFGNSKYFILIIIFLIFATFLGIIFFIQSRDNIFIKLKEQQNIEIKKNTEFLKSYKSKIENSTKNQKYRKNKIKEFEKKEKEILENLRKKQKEQRKKIKELRKKQPNKNKIIREMIKWKRQGYELSEAKKEVSKISKSLIKHKFKDWKKEGYKF